MGFETPAMLWGLLVAGLPVAIHLIQRRRARVVPFAAIEFLLAGDARQARRLRIQQWLVLALRVGLLAALVLALAKPYVTADAQPAVASGEPSAVVLLLDDSASMAAVNENGERLFDRMREAARDRIEAGGPLARFGLVATSRPARGLTEGLIQDQSELLRILDRLEVSDRGADPSQALYEAERLLEDSVDEAKVLWIGSDRAHHAWSAAPTMGSKETEEAPTWIEVAPLAIDPKRENLSIDGVTPTPGAGPSGETGFEVEVTNHGQRPAKAEVRVRVGERVSAVSLEVPPGETQQANLYIALEVDLGERLGFAELTSEADALRMDDRYHFELSEALALRIAVVNGSPRNVPWLDEVFFVRAGLAARGATGERWSPEHVQTTELTSGLLIHTDVLILANVGALADSQALAIRRFVQEGGGLLIAVGDQMGAQSNASYGGLLPTPIRSLKRRDTRLMDASSRDLDGGLSIERRDHPILRAFTSEESGSLTRARARTLALLNEQRRPGLEILARWSQGEPALLELPMGEGRILLLTTSLDRDGSDLVLRTSFVPFLQRTVEYLAGRFDRDHGGSLALGSPTILDAPPGSGPVVLTGPRGLELELEARSARTGQPERVELPPLERAGSYSLSRRNDPLGARGFCLNVDRSESDLAVYEPRELQDRLHGSGGKTDAPSPKVSLTGAVSPAAPTRGEPLWPVALLALFGILIGEAWFALKAG